MHHHLMLQRNMLALGLALGVLVPAGALAQAVELSAPRGVPVGVRSSSSGLSLFVRRGERYNVRYEHLCAAPCELSLEPGRYSFGVSMDGFTVVDDAEPVNLMGPSILELGVRSARRRRVLSWIVLIVGEVGGSALMIASILPDHVNMPMLVTGALLETAGLIAIFPAASAHDHAWVHVRRR